MAQPRMSASAPKLPRNFSLRSSAPSQPAFAAVTATAAPPSNPPSIEERRKIAQEAQEKTPFVVTEVDAAEQKDFYDAPVLGVTEVAPGVRCITVQAEISREVRLSGTPPARARAECRHSGANGLPKPKACRCFPDPDVPCHAVSELTNFLTET